MKYIAALLAFAFTFSACDSKVKTDKEMNLIAGAKTRVELDGKKDTFNAGSEDERRKMISEYAVGLDYSGIKSVEAIGVDPKRK